MAFRLRLQLSSPLRDEIMLGMDPPMLLPSMWSCFRSAMRPTCRGRLPDSLFSSRNNPCRSLRWPIVVGTCPLKWLLVRTSSVRRVTLVKISAEMVPRRFIFSRINTSSFVSLARSAGRKPVRWLPLRLSSTRDVSLGMLSGKGPSSSLSSRYSLLSLVRSSRSGMVPFNLFLSSPRDRRSIMCSSSPGMDPFSSFAPTLNCRMLVSEVPYSLGIVPVSLFL
mmetsp:Transcript_16600/g.45714  ORF Transcript_16600/g.45714 Transcript_16600/m.45714 type:complete len:222 (+) Transcript_16600:339-1004(+)